ncbi:MAG: pyridoxal phosphate-dependent aminotransferase [Haliscomenobacter sp.]|nr:pyridoxal phosphate-dependent aminotransferase [Haliscomenobacter sp.]MBK7474687.1 pyridoxal phosphate-dependent aminotransferase [Haliscomenobacter sp.]MBK8877666.1 pyridoxal phosphate-dependent aminotransferase [Haliscomenobacter sp.]
MPNVSKRSQEVPLSPFRKLATLAEQVKQEGRKVYHLNIGQPDILTPPGAIARLKEMPFSIVPYTPAEGLYSLRKAMAFYYGRMGIPVVPEEVVITTGASEGLQLALLTCFEQGDEVIIPEPFYANYSGFAQIAGVRVVPVKSNIETGFTMPGISDFEALITPRTKGILLCNPSNPTGTFYPKEVVLALGDLVRRYGLFLLVDEVYRDFIYDGQNFFSAMEISGLEDHVILIDSVSKRFSACGARVGALVTRNREVIEQVSRYAKLRLSPPFLGQILAEFMLEEASEYLGPVISEYNARRNILFERLSAIPGVVSYKPGGAFYCFAKFPVADADHFCEWLLGSYSYKGATVMLSSGSGFYATPGLGIDEVRIAYILNQTDLHSAMDVLEQALAVYPGRLQPV